MMQRFKIEDINTDNYLMLINDNPKIVYEIVRGILYGIKHGHQRVDLFEIQTLQGIQTFSAPRNEWRKALEKSILVMIEIEDYETCSDIKKAFEILS